METTSQYILYSLSFIIAKHRLQVCLQQRIGDLGQAQPLLGLHHQWCVQEQNWHQAKYRHYANAPCATINSRQLTTPTMSFVSRGRAHKAPRQRVGSKKRRVKGSEGGVAGEKKQKGGKKQKQIERVEAHCETLAHLGSQRTSSHSLQMVSGRVSNC